MSEHSHLKNMKSGTLRLPNVEDYVGKTNISALKAKRHTAAHYPDERHPILHAYASQMSIVSITICHVHICMVTCPMGLLCLFLGEHDATISRLSFNF